MTLQEVEPDSDSWNEQPERQRRVARNRRVVALAVAASILAAVIVALVVNGGRRPELDPSVGSEPEGADLSIVDVVSGRNAVHGSSRGL